VKQQNAAIAKPSQRAPGDHVCTWPICIPYTQGPCDWKAPGLCRAPIYPGVSPPVRRPEKQGLHTGYFLDQIVSPVDLIANVSGVFEGEHAVIAGVIPDLMSFGDLPFQRIRKHLGIFTYDKKGGFCVG
jgi:hypothetical protein